MSLNRNPMIVHRLKSACGHLEATANAFETGQPSQQTLQQLGAVEAALRQLCLEIVMQEMLHTVNIIRTSAREEEVRAAAGHFAELYERYCRMLWVP